MKQCPVCQNTYTDETLQFCLADGAALISVSNTTQPTLQFPGNTNPIRVNIGEETPTIVKPNLPLIQPEPVKKGGSGLIIGLLVVILAIVILGSAGVIGWLLFRDKGDPNTVVNNVKPNSNITNSTQPQKQTPNTDENEDLKKKIADLEKQVQDQQKKNTTVPTINNPTTTNTPSSNKVTARVNSPNDGFLALRTEPSAETGERILQIPHGATLTVMACLPKAAGKKGRWCRVNYSGNVGWAYDGFLIY